MPTMKVMIAAEIWIPDGGDQASMGQHFRELSRTAENGVGNMADTELSIDEITVTEVLEGDPIPPGQEHFPCERQKRTESVAVR